MLEIKPRQFPLITGTIPSYPVEILILGYEGEESETDVHLVVVQEI